MLVSHKFSPHGQFLSVERIKLWNLPISTSSWQSLTSNPLLLNLRHVAGHIARELGMYIRDILDWKNIEVYQDSLMNGHWEVLFKKVEELLHARDDPDNCCMHIQYIIQFSFNDLLHQQESKLESIMKFMKQMKLALEKVKSMIYESQEYLRHSYYTPISY